VIMGVISSVLLLGNAALASSATNVFWMMFKLSGLCFLVSYLMVFPAFALLRRKRAEQPRPYRMPGGPGVAWTAAVVCWLFIAMACALFFKPSPDIPPAQARQETLLLAGETLVTLVVGLLLLPKRAR
jgi:amino acid transporter